MKFAKLMFLHLSVNHSVHRGVVCGCRRVCVVEVGGVCGCGGHAWLWGHAWLQGACVAAGDMCGCGGMGMCGIQ